MCGTPPQGGGQKVFPQNLHTATHLIFWGFWGFWVKKGQKNFGPKMVQNHSKMEIPCFWPLFQVVTGQLDHPVADFRKRGNPPPLAGPSAIRPPGAALFSEFGGSLTAR